MLSVCLAASLAVAGPLEDGAEAAERGDYATALRLTRQLAEEGYAVAQNNLGLMYLEGKGIPQKEYVAMRLFRRAAERTAVR